jgi:ketosteroid isomerase-like protein
MMKTSLIAGGLAVALLASPALAQNPHAIHTTPPAQAAQTHPTAQTVDRQAALDSLVAAEKAFAKDAAEKGTHDSFLDFLADDGVMFTPDPVNGKEFLRGKPGSPGLLSWFPVYSEVSLAGDLGYNTGPFEFRQAAGEKPGGIGLFSTVWKRQPDGSWKALVDLGTPGSPPSSGTIALKGPARVAAADLSKVDAAAEKTSLLLAERTLDRATRLQGASGIGQFLADDAQLLRARRPAIAGKAPIQAALAEDKAPIGWEPAGSGISRSADLGYIFGTAKERESGPESPWVKTGNYLRVWRKGADGAWKVAFDVLSPRPKPAPKPAEEKKPSSGS